MATLGSIHHDFARLAKQSGFYFQLHTGRVNWSEIENLNIDDIVVKRNFQLLEQNLINVINCNLEREYDLKILDQNFVKLFKLAQLGIDYLSYCEIYLDRCVVLLQEQLTVFQEEYESLKQDNQKRREEFSKSKRKNRMQSYQCEKCEKVFISDVYLKFHDKRRHSNPNTPDSLDVLQKKCIDNSQQTDDGGTLSTSTQTLPLEKVTPVPQICEDMDSVKQEHTIKIEKLEQELRDLKERLKKAESSLIKKTDSSQSSQSNVFHPVNIPGSLYCNPMLMLLPPYLKQSGNGYYEINPGCQIPVQEVNQHGNTVSPPPVNSEAVEIKPQQENKLELNNELPEQFSKKWKWSEEVDKPCAAVEKTRSFQEYEREGKDSLDYDKENINPDLQKNILTNLTKPLPPPRKLKKGIQTHDTKYNVILDDKNDTKIKLHEFGVEAKTDMHQEEETEAISSRSIVHRSTPVKEKSTGEEDRENLEGCRDHVSKIKKEGSHSNETLNSRKFVSIDRENLIKNIIGRNSPKLRKFGKNLKRSLTNLYDSMSSTEKDLKKRESNVQQMRAAVVNGVNDRLRELGVDPEWQGIPKKTMKQKLNVLKHRRRLLSKENPMFPVIRQNIEEKLLKKIRNNLGRKKTTLINKLSQQMDAEDHSTQDISFKDKSEFVSVKKCLMYDNDTDSESKASDLERNFTRYQDQSFSPSVVLEELTSSDEEEKVGTKKSREFDFSVFQVGGGSLSGLTHFTRQKQVSVNKMDEPHTDSDADGNSLGHSEDKILNTLKGYLSEKTIDEHREAPKNRDNTEPLVEFSCMEKAKGENHSILKDSENLQSRLSMNAKKKVLFANYSDGIEGELSDSPMDDDLWPFKSDSEKDVG